MKSNVKWGHGEEEHAIGGGDYVCPSLSSSLHDRTDGVKLSTSGWWWVFPGLIRLHGFM